MSLLGQFKKASFWSFINSISKSILSIVISYYIIKSISVYDYGVFNLLIGVIGYIQLFVLPGIIQVINRFIPEFYQTKDYFGIYFLTKKYLIRTFFISICCLFVVYVFNDFIARTFDINDFWNIFIWIIPFIPFYFLGMIFNQLFQSLFFQKSLSIINTISESFRLISLFAFFYFDKSISFLLLSQGLTWVLSFILYVIYYRKLFYNVFKDKFEKRIFELHRYKKYGFYTFFNEIGAKVLNNSTDYFIISAYLGPVSTGYYAFVNKIITVSTNLLPNRILKSTLKTYFYRDYTENKNAQILQRNFNYILKFNMVFVLPLAYLLITYGTYFIDLFFDKKYDNVSNILFVFALFLPTKCLTSPLGLFLTALEDVKIILYSKLASFVNIIIGIFVVQEYGVVGLSIVTCLSVFLKDIIIYIYAYRKHKLTLPFLDMMKIIVIGLLIYILGNGILKLDSLLLNILGIFLTLSLTYALYFFTLFDTLERTTLLKMIKRK